MGWKDKAAAGKSLSKILESDFDKIILTHGDHVASADPELASLGSWSGVICFSVLAVACLAVCVELR